MAKTVVNPIWSEDGKTLTNTLVDNKLKTYNVVTQWWDGTPMDSSKIDDNFVYVSYEGKFLKENFVKEQDTFLEKNTMQEMRNLSDKEILLLKMGVYKGVKLNGYYSEGDTPAPIEYYISDTGSPDDKGSVVEIGEVKLKHTFTGGIVSLAYYGHFDNTTDIGDSLVFICNLFKHSTVIVEANTTLFLDVTKARVIGGDYSKSLIIRGKSNNTSIITMNTYTNVSGSLSNWRLLLALDNIQFQGMTDTVQTYTKGLNSYLVCNWFIINSKFDNFNGSIHLPMITATDVYNNYFGKFTDHALYFRNSNITDNKQLILNIHTNEFKGANSVSGFTGQSTSDPRECIKLAGQLEEVNIYNNTFKGWGVNVIVSVGGTAEQGPYQKSINKFTFNNNICYTGYASINYNTVTSDTFKYSNTHIISNNTFDLNSNLDYGDKDFNFTAHINTATNGIGFVKLNIESNVFNNSGTFAIQTNQLTNRLMENELKIGGTNTFINSRLYLRSIKICDIDNAKFINNTSTTLAVINTPSFENFNVRNCTVQDVGIFMQYTIGANTPIATFESNIFINVGKIHQSNSYGLSHIWKNNIFKNCIEFISNQGATTASANGFKMINNDLINTPYSLDALINTAISRVDLSPSNVNGAKVLTSDMLGADGRKIGSFYIDSTTGYWKYYHNNSWKFLNSNATVSTKGLVNQSTAITNSEAPQAIDLPTALVLINELQTKINAMLVTDRTSGQRAN